MATTSVDATTVTFLQAAPTAVSHSSQAPLAPNAAFRFESNAQLRLALHDIIRCRVHLLVSQRHSPSPAKANSGPKKFSSRTRIPASRMTRNASTRHQAA